MTTPVTFVTILLCFLLFSTAKEFIVLKTTNTIVRHIFFVFRNMIRCLQRRKEGCAPDPRDLQQMFATTVQEFLREVQVQCPMFRQDYLFLNYQLNCYQLKKEKGVYAIGNYSLFSLLLC